MNTFRYRIRTLYQYKDLIKELVSRDIKLKYRRSFLGYVWSVLNPLLIMIVMTVVFSAMFNRNIENYPVYLLIGRSLYDFMTASTNGAMGSVTGNASLLKKTYIPKYIFTLSKVTSCLVDFVFSLGALLIVMIVTRSPFHVEMLLLPLIILQIYIFCCGPGLSAGTVPCVFPGYPVYLQGHHYGLDVPDPDFLSVRAAAGGTAAAD